jgi:glutathione S-transferase
MIAAHEAGVAGRLELVRTVVSSTTPNLELLNENPLSKLPTLTLRDNTSIYDSCVIVEYFAQLAPTSGLIPTGPERLIALRQQALGDGLLDLMLLWLDERHRPQAHQSAVHLKSHTIKFHAVIAQLGRELPLLRNRPFDIGHISIGCGLSYVGFRFPDLEWQERGAPLAEWLNEFHHRPSVLAVPVVDDMDTPIQPANELLQAHDHPEQAG